MPKAKVYIARHISGYCEPIRGYAILLTTLSFLIDFVDCENDRLTFSHRSPGFVNFVAFDVMSSFITLSMESCLLG